MLRTYTQKIKRRLRLARERLYYERGDRLPASGEIHAALRQDLRDHVVGDGVEEQVFDRWLSETPRRIRTYRSEYLPDSVQSQIAAGKTRMFERDLDLSGGVDWHKDPLFDVQWARKYVGAMSDYRDDSDLVALWHLNKMSFAADASYAYRLTENPALAEMCLRWLMTWIEQNPYMVGMNWRSPMEVGTRLFSWSIVLHEVGFSPVIRPEHKRTILASMYQHARLLASDFSFREVPNNHLIGEAATLYFFAALWPQWDESEAWRRKSEEVLLQEVERQVLPDGYHFENSFNYHLYVVDFLMIYLYAKALTGEPPHARIHNAVLRLVRTVLEFRSSNGRIPRFGDDSMHDFMVLKSLDEMEDRHFTSAQTFSELVQPSIGSVIAAHGWGHKLMTTAVDSQIATIKEDCGFAVFRSERHQLTYAAGPCHNQPISDGHLHSDAGSFELEVEGTPFIIDSGTFLYGRDPDDRLHFKSVGAHNSLELDGVDPFESVETFKWREVVRNRITHFAAGDGFGVVGSVRDLPSAAGGYSHHRILCDLGGTAWVVVDRLYGTGAGKEVRATCRFHLPVDRSQVQTRDGSAVDVRYRKDDDHGLRLSVFSSSPAELDLAGEKERESMWSPSYGILRRGTTVRTICPLRNSVVIVHSIADPGTVVDAAVSDEAARIQVGGASITFDTGDLSISLDGQIVRARAE